MPVEGQHRAAVVFLRPGDHAGKEQGGERKPCRAAPSAASHQWRPGAFLFHGVVATRAAVARLRQRASFYAGRIA